MGINKVILVGNVGRDVEFRALPSGTNLAKFSLATTDRRSKDENGKPRTEWHNIVAWGKLAEICNQYLVKGQQVYIEGRLQTRRWEEDGVRRSTVEIVAKEMVMLGKRKRKENAEDQDEIDEFETDLAEDEEDEFPF